MHLRAFPMAPTCPARAEVGAFLALAGGFRGNARKLIQMKNKSAR